MDKSFIYNNITGYELWSGKNEHEVWAEIVTNDSMVIPVARDKEELRQWIIKETSRNAIKPTSYNTLFELI